MWSPTSDCLGPLAAEGRERALFCVHAIGGTVGFFNPFAERLSSVRDVYGLQCHGVTPGNDPDLTVEAMAERYVAEVTALRPHGPYEVVGYSMGGLIAFEMARQLTLGGERVALAGMLDTVPPGKVVAPIETAGALSLVSRAIGLFPPFEPEDPDRPDDELLEEFRAAAVAKGVLPEKFRARDLRPMIDIYTVNGQAANDYRPRSAYPGDLHCLFTESAGLYRDQENWYRYITGKVVVDMIEADHFTLMHEQHAQQVAGTVMGWLKDID